MSLDSFVIDLDFPSQLSSMKPEKDVQFLMWHSAGTRIAHLLGYHKLGANPETMPDEDPGLPHGSNSMKRQAVLTAWNEIYFIDSMGGAQRGYFTIDDREFDTVPPYNVVSHQEVSIGISSSFVDRMILTSDSISTSIRSLPVNLPTTRSAL